jgi:hypothetical protein
MLCASVGEFAADRADRPPRSQRRRGGRGRAGGRAIRGGSRAVGRCLFASGAEHSVIFASAEASTFSSFGGSDGVPRRRRESIF